MKTCIEIWGKEYLRFCDTRSIVSLEDKGTTQYIATNKEKKQVGVYRVDGGLISDNEKKCDYLLFTETGAKKDIYLIELKGQNIVQALRQLNRSVDVLIIEEKNEFHSVNCRLVATKQRTPDINTSDEIRLKKKLNMYNGNLKKGNLLLKEEI